VIISGHNFYPQSPHLAKFVRYDKRPFLACQILEAIRSFADKFKDDALKAVATALFISLRIDVLLRGNDHKSLRSNPEMDGYNFKIEVKDLPSKITPRDELFSLTQALGSVISRKNDKCWDRSEWLKISSALTRVSRELAIFDRAQRKEGDENWRSFRSGWGMGESLEIIKLADPEIVSGSFRIAVACTFQALDTVVTSLCYPDSTFRRKAPCDGYNKAVEIVKKFPPSEDTDTLNIEKYNTRWVSLYEADRKTVDEFLKHSSEGTRSSMWYFNKIVNNFYVKTDPSTFNESKRFPSIKPTKRPAREQQEPTLPPKIGKQLKEKFSLLWAFSKAYVCDKNMCYIHLEESPLASTVIKPEPSLPIMHSYPPAGSKDLPVKPVNESDDIVVVRCRAMTI